MSLNQEIRWRVPVAAGELGVLVLMAAGVLTFLLSASHERSSLDRDLERRAGGPAGELFGGGGPPPGGAFGEHEFCTRTQRPAGEGLVAQKCTVRAGFPRPPPPPGRGGPPPPRLPGP